MLACLQQGAQGLLQTADCTKGLEHEPPLSSIDAQPTACSCTFNHTSTQPLNVAHLPVCRRGAAASGAVRAAAPRALNFTDSNHTDRK